MALPIFFAGGTAPLAKRKSVTTVKGMTTMIDERLACLRTHRNNIARYRRLLKTMLTGLERQFIERRLSEEQSEYERLAAGTFPIAFKLPQAPPERPPGRETA